MGARGHEVVDDPDASVLRFEDLEREHGPLLTVAGAVEAGAGATGPASGDQPARGPTRSSRATRARWSVLFADHTEHARASAVSAAERPTTSRRRSTARWGGVSTWSAATKARATLSFIVYCAAGLPSSGVTPESHADGAGSSHSASGVRAASGASGSAGGPSSGPRARRGRFASSSMHTLVAMR